MNRPEAGLQQEHMASPSLFNGPQTLGAIRFSSFQGSWLPLDTGLSSYREKEKPSLRATAGLWCSLVEHKYFHRIECQHPTRLLCDHDGAKRQ